MDGRIAVLKSPKGAWEFRRYAVPDPDPGAIVVKITYANVCGSDLHQWRGETNFPAEGRPMGHEMTGRIVALGPGVETDSTGQPLRPGDRIVYNYFFPCGRCRACLRDQPECCPEQTAPRQLPHRELPPGGSEADRWPQPVGTRGSGGNERAVGRLPAMHNYISTRQQR
jgi:threonine dehydrogenase-like Zn-dependent dehydrogenase